MLSKKKEDPRTTRSRKLLRDAFTELLSRKTFDSITVQDITEHATLNRATFYAHFADKQALLVHCFGELFNELVRARLPINSELNPSNMKLAITLVCEYLEVLFTQYHAKQNEAFAPLMERQLKTHLHRLLALWLKKSKPQAFKAGMSPDLVVTAATCAIYGSAVQWAQGTRTETPEKLAQQIFPMIRALLGTETT